MIQDKTDLNEYRVPVLIAGTIIVFAKTDIAAAMLIHDTLGGNKVFDIRGDYLDHDKMLLLEPELSLGGINKPEQVE